MNRGQKCLGEIRYDGTEFGTQLNNRDSFIRQWRLEDPGAVASRVELRCLHAGEAASKGVLSYARFEDQTKPAKTR